MGGQGLTLSDWELVDVADYEAVRDVGTINGFFDGKVVVVADAGGAGIGPAIVSFDVVDELRERVGGQCAKAGVESVRVGQLKSVVVRVSNRSGLVRDAAVMRVGTEKLLPGNGRNRSR